MISWFIVAIVYMQDGTERIKQMQKPFRTRELCQQFYRDTPSVRRDIMVMFPQQTGHTLVCLDQNQITEMESLST